MRNPVLLTVDDDVEVLRAIERDLRHRYGEHYRVLRADSGPAALEIVQQLKRRNDPLALFLVDQRMPGMTGVEFLELARVDFPEAKRVLLTAYSDTEAAIQSINRAQVDYYLTKPWEPPAERLYPVLDDLLEDWRAGYRPVFAGLRVVGPRWSPQTHEIKDFLARNQVPYEWMDAEKHPDQVLALASNGSGTPELPAVILPDGSHLYRPDLATLARHIGLTTQAKLPFYDLVIVGGGPAGLGAAVNAASEGLKTLLIEREAPGGQAGSSSRIENYMGFPAGLSGADLTRRAVTQARRFGVEILTPQSVRSVRVQDLYRVITLCDDTEVSCHALLIATGVAWRRLRVPGADRLQGAGVYYGASLMEANSCKGEKVFIVGGANSAGQAAMHFSKFADEVTMLVRGSSLAKSMSSYLVEQIAATSNIHVRVNTDIVEVAGQERLESITVVDHGVDDTRQTLPATSVFIFIGAMPQTEWLDGVVERDKHGFVLDGPELKRAGCLPAAWGLPRDPYIMETSVPGIFVAGDVRAGSVKRVASAAGQGGIAVELIHQYLGTYKP